MRLAIWVGLILASAANLALARGLPPGGPPRSPDFFPLAVWFQAPSERWEFGDHRTKAAAMAAEHMNIVLGLGGLLGGQHTWPESFGRDSGELEAIKASHLYVIGGLNTPFAENTSADSVASMIALAGRQHAGDSLIGYNIGDEPDCTVLPKVPKIVASIRAFDPTRIVTDNQTAWVTWPQWMKCLDAAIAALRATDVASFDLYPLTRPWIGANEIYPKSDFATTPNDTLFYQGVATQALRHFARADQLIWAFVEAGGDNFGYAEEGGNVESAVTAGSEILTNVSNRSKFTGTWIGLSVSGPGIPAKTTIVSINDASHAVMSAKATGTSAREPVAVKGGVHDSDCVERFNICVANGNEYRPTPAEVNAEVWMSLINGATGIEYFCHDLSSVSFCLGDRRGGPAAEATAVNLTYINKTILGLAPVLNAPTLGLCSMEHEDYATGGLSTTVSCADRTLSLTTSRASVPGAALAKAHEGATYLFAQSNRRSRTGATFTFGLEGQGDRTAQVVYDSNARYHPARAAVGATFRLDSRGRFSDTFGADQDDYQVKIYAIR